ncbi:MAG: DsrE/DsrF/DrsH-like family protein [Thermoplasmata archaeon]|nr:DsrE/DsrF/DrsH-like family protein [Thermoplasmata archaeon]
MAEKLCIVVSEGSFDKAIMSLMLATTGASMGLEAHVFYSFFGLKLLKKGTKPKLPGIMKPFTFMMTGKMKKMKMPGYQEMLQQAIDLGVNLYACSTTMSLMNVSESDLVKGTKVLGASAFLNMAADAKVNLFIG